MSTTTGVRQFALAAVLWGVVGMLVGVIIAAQLAWPELNLRHSVAELRPAAPAAHQRGDLRLRRLRAVRHRLPRRAAHLPDAAVRARAGRVHLLGLAARDRRGGRHAAAGHDQGKEYAELEWPIDILIALVWVGYAIVFFGTIGIRKVRHIYVANWFFGAFILAVALLHIVNSAALPVSLTKSYSAYAGVQDAMVQWWYGHNAVGFFLTAGFLGMMYYFIPKQAERPVYSYRLSIVHFWALIFTYMWAGPHHLHYTALPDWAQSVGMVFSLVLLAPSWGGMINGIMTLSGAWHKLRDDPILKFLIVSLSFYGMSTFEGPMMSIKTVNALSHYTDWTVGHVHSGALGWVGFISMGALYYLIPRLFGRTQMHSVRAIEMHFWIATIGIVLYIAAMWIAGVMQGLMWRAVNPDGTLVYSFVESVKATYPFYVVRLLGGLLYLGGMLIMAWNVVMTVRSGKAAPAPIPSSPRRTPEEEKQEHGNTHQAFRSREHRDQQLPDDRADPARGGRRRHRRDRAAVLPAQHDAAGGGPQALHGAAARRARHLHPRGLLQLPLADGPAVPRRDACATASYSMAGEFVYDHPVPVGQQAHRPRPAPRGRQLQRRVAPHPPEQPARPGARVEHAGLPVAVTATVDPAQMAPRMKALRTVGVPYTDAEIAKAGEDVKGKTELDALIAYLQVLGTAVK